MTHVSRLLTLLLVLASLVGCDPSDTNSSSTDQVEKQAKLPKLTFHRPNSLASAIERIEEMHSILVSDAELPPPKSFDIVEIIHGEGASGHSHYYLADKMDSEPTEHHEGMNETRKQHVLKVDFITEYSDIIRWLPKIAADSDLTEEEWNLVEATSKQLQDEVEQTQLLKMDSDSRQLYQKRQDEISKLIQKLETAETQG